jgi:hypothetical protein
MFCCAPCLPHCSRSSALASKATGFPIAKIAAKLACGTTLDMIPNDITLKTPASFEPSIDYVVTKIPRFAFEKFPGAQVWAALGACTFALVAGRCPSPRLGIASQAAWFFADLPDSAGRRPRSHICCLPTELCRLLPACAPRVPALQPVLTTQMKSVGEAMAIGRTFQESFQKAMRSLETGLDGWSLPRNHKRLPHDKLIYNMRVPNPERMVAIKQALEDGETLDDIHEYTKIDPWFLAQVGAVPRVPCCAALPGPVA